VDVRVKNDSTNASVPCEFQQRSRPRCLKVKAQPCFERLDGQEPCASALARFRHVAPMFFHLLPRFLEQVYSVEMESVGRADLSSCTAASEIRERGRHTALSDFQRFRSAMHLSETELPLRLIADSVG